MAKKILKELLINQGGVKGVGFACIFAPKRSWNLMTRIRRMLHARKIVFAAN
jgi:hypothetical protein